ALVNAVEVRLETLESLAGDEETLVFYDLKLIGRERRFNGTIRLLMDLDDSVDSNGELWTFKNGEWVKSNFKQQGKSCRIFNTFMTHYFKDEIKKTDFPDPLCPLPKGIYPIRNIKLNGDSWPPYLGRGLTKVKFTFHKNDKMVGGIIFSMNLIDEHI
ncbi:hypothetical protein KR026_005721, partial [Drosophila bipectinata]